MFFILFCIIMPILFVIYNIIYYFNKKVIYTLKDKKFIIINDNFFKIQLFLSCVNAMLSAIVIYLFYKFDNHPLGLLLFIVTFWGINYLIKFITISLNYAKVEN